MILVQLLFGLNKFRHTKNTIEFIYKSKLMLLRLTLTQQKNWSLYNHSSPKHSLPWQGLRQMLLLLCQQEQNNFFLKIKLYSFSSTPLHFIGKT